MRGESIAYHFPYQGGPGLGVDQQLLCSGERMETGGEILQACGVSMPESVTRDRLNHRQKIADAVTEFPRGQVAPLAGTLRIGESGPQQHVIRFEINDEFGAGMAIRRRPFMRSLDRSQVVQHLNCLGSDLCEGWNARPQRCRRCRT
jgi:hypothetical protein